MKILKRKMKKKKNQKIKNETIINFGIFETFNFKTWCKKFYDILILFEMFKLALFLYINLYFDISILKIH